MFVGHQGELLHINTNPCDTETKSLLVNSIIKSISAHSY